MPRGQVPEWATELIERVCRDYGRKPAQIRSWSHRPDQYSTGTTWDRDRTISIREGTDPLQARTVLLHELAHYLVHPKHDHDKVFWVKAWELHIIYGCLAVAWPIETSYKVKALTYAPPLVRKAFGGG